MSYKRINNNMVQVNIDTEKGQVEITELISVGTGRHNVFCVDSIQLIQKIYRQCAVGYQDKYEDVLKHIMSFLPADWVKTADGLYRPIKKGARVVGRWGAMIADGEGIVKSVGRSQGDIIVKWSGNPVTCRYAQKDIRRGGCDCKSPIGVYLVEGE